MNRNLKGEVKLLSVTKIFRFEAAHVISNHPGDCKNVHGHSYELQVTISGEIEPESDMLIDFKRLKEIVDRQAVSELDHALLLKDNPANRTVFEGKSNKIVWLGHEPTAERLVLLMAHRIIPELPGHLQLKGLRLYETNTAFAEWTTD